MKIKVVPFIAVILAALTVTYCWAGNEKVINQVAQLGVESACLNQQYQVVNASPQSLCKTVKHLMTNYEEKFSVSMADFIGNWQSECISENGDARYCEESEITSDILDRAVSVAACEFDGVIISRPDYDWVMTQHYGIVYSDFEYHFGCNKKNTVQYSEEGFLGTEDYPSYDDVLSERVQALFDSIEKGDINGIRKNTLFKDPSASEIESILVNVYWMEGLTPSILDVFHEAGIPYINKQDYYQQPLVAALEAKNFEAADWLIEHGAPTDVVDQKGYPLIVVAAKTGHFDLVKKLLAQGVDIEGQENVESNRYFTTIQAAASGGHKDIVDFLYAKGAKIPKGEELTSWGGSHFSSIYFAVQGGSVEIVEKFIEWSGVKGEPNDLIAWAVYSIRENRGEPDMLKVLYDAGFEHKDTQPLEFLMQAMPTYLSEEIEDKSLFEAKAVLDILLDHNMDVSNYQENKQNKNIISRVLSAPNYNAYLSSGDKKQQEYGDWLKSFTAYSVDRFIEQGVAVNEQDPFGRTPLQLAASKCYPDIVSKLLKAGADPSMADERNRKPVDGPVFIIEKAKKLSSPMHEYLVPECRKTLDVLSGI